MKSSDWGLIALGMALAALGAGAVMLLVVALSQLYVGSWAPALGELAACVLAGGAFLKAYGPYLDRLERRAPPEPTPSDSPTSDPAPTSVVVAVVTGAYGLILIVAGFVWTIGTARILNSVGGLGLMACAGLVWWMGRDAPQDTR